MLTIGEEKIGKYSEGEKGQSWAVSYFWSEFFLKEVLGLSANEETTIMLDNLLRQSCEYERLKLKEFSFSFPFYSRMTFTLANQWPSLYIFKVMFFFNNCKWCCLIWKHEVWETKWQLVRRYNFLDSYLFCVQNLCCTALEDSLIPFTDRVEGEWDWCVRGDFISWILHFFSI